MTKDKNLFAKLDTKKAAVDEPVTEEEIVTEDAPEVEEELPELIIPEPAPVVDLLEVARRKADLVGAPYDEKDSADLVAYKTDEFVKAQFESSKAPAPAEPVVEKSQMTLREEIYREEMKLVRIRLTNMDDKDSKLEGDFYSVSNEYIGDVSKFIPYGDKTEAGYHVPNCIYKMLRDQKYVQFYTTTVDGRTVNRNRLARKFAIEILPPLTKDELRDLAQRQLASGNLED